MELYKVCHTVENRGLLELFMYPAFSTKIRVISRLYIMSIVSVDQLQFLMRNPYGKCFNPYPAVKPISTAAHHDNCCC